MAIFAYALLMADDSYLAGFFDGEGHIGIARRTHNLLVDVTNINRAVMELFVARFGGRIRERPSRYLNGKPVFMWRLVSAEAEAAVRALEPFLVVKKHRAQRALEFRDLFKGKNRLHFGANGHVPTAAEIETRDRVRALRTTFYEEFRLLNS